MRLRTDHPQMIAAAKAGLSVATARRIDLDPRPPSAKKQRRTYRTRPDPLDGLWDKEILPLLTAAPGLRPITLFDELARRHPDRIGPSFRRTLERRIADWKALHGSNLNVIFPQIQQPGRMGLSDFTDANGFGVIVGGQRLEHRLYHFALAFPASNMPRSYWAARVARPWPAVWRTLCACSAGFRGRIAAIVFRRHFAIWPCRMPRT